MFYAWFVDLHACMSNEMTGIMEAASIRETKEPYINFLLEVYKPYAAYAGLEDW